MLINAISNLGHRGVFRKLRLDPGNYIIVTSTYRPNQAGEFFIRTFSKTGNTLGYDGKISFATFQTDPIHLTELVSVDTQLQNVNCQSTEPI